MYNVVKATEAGCEDLTAARDWLIPPPRRTASLAPVEANPNQGQTGVETTCGVGTVEGMTR
jgi:hypothetical protein